MDDMEPITTIVAAISAGALAASKDLASTAIKDAYAALKRVISDRYSKTGPFVEAVTAQPSSEPERQLLAKQLDKAGAGDDPELKALAVQLLDAVHELRKEPQAAALFDFDNLRAARNFALEDIQAVGGILRVKGDANFEGDFSAKGIRQIPAGGSEKN
jgi:hypothetical protein